MYSYKYDFKNGNEYLVVCKCGESLGLNYPGKINTWVTIDSIEDGGYAWCTFDNVGGDRLETPVLLLDLSYYIEDESAFNS